MYLDILYIHAKLYMLNVSCFCATKIQLLRSVLSFYNFYHIIDDMWYLKHLFQYLNTLNIWQPQRHQLYADCECTDGKYWGSHILYIHALTSWHMLLFCLSGIWVHLCVCYLLNHLISIPAAGTSYNNHKFGTEFLFALSLYQFKYSNSEVGLLKIKKIFFPVFNSLVWVSLC